MSSRFRQVSKALKKYIDSLQFPEVPEKGKVIKLYNLNAFTSLVGMSTFCRPVLKS